MFFSLNRSIVVRGFIAFYALQHIKTALIFLLTSNLGYYQGLISVHIVHFNTAYSFFFCLKFRQVVRLKVVIICFSIIFIL